MLNLLSTKAVEAMAILLTIALACIGYLLFVNSSLKSDLKEQKLTHEKQVLLLEQHAKKLAYEYNSALEQASILALNETNARLKTARAKEARLKASLTKALKEAKENERKTTALSNELNRSTRSLQQLTQEATRIAKASVGSSRECMSGNTGIHSDRQASIERKLQAKIIEATGQMVQECIQFSEEIEHDFSKLQHQARLLSKQIEFTKQTLVEEKTK